MYFDSAVCNLPGYASSVHDRETLSANIVSGARWCSGMLLGQRCRGGGFDSRCAL